MTCTSTMQVDNLRLKLNGDVDDVVTLLQFILSYILTGKKNQSIRRLPSIADF